MARPIGTAQHLGDDRWRLHLEQPPDPLTGRRRRRSKIVRADSERAARKQLADLAGDEPAARERRTVNELLDAWLAHHQAAPSTLAAWRHALSLYVRPHIGGRPVGAVTAETLERLYGVLLAGGGHKGRALSPATVRKAHAPLRLAFAQALRWGWIDTNPADTAVAPTARAVRPQVPDPKLVAKLIAKAEKTRPDFACYIHLAANLGHRRGEALGLQWRDVDLDAGTIEIRRVVELVDGKANIAERTKTDASQRTVQLGRRALATLKAMRGRHAARALAVGATLTPTAFVFSDQADGSTPWHPRTVNKRFTVIRDKVPGAEAVKPHHLRHYMATRMLAAGYDVVTVAGRGGWANPYTLLTVYAHWLPQRDAAAAEDLDAELG